MPHGRRNGPSSHLKSEHVELDHLVRELLHAHGREPDLVEGRPERLPPVIGGGLEPPPVALGARPAESGVEDHGLAAVQRLPGQDRAEGVEVHVGEALCVAWKEIAR